MRPELKRKTQWPGVYTYRRRTAEGSSRASCWRVGTNGCQLPSASHLKLADRTQALAVGFAYTHPSSGTMSTGTTESAIITAVGPGKQATFVSDVAEVTADETQAHTYLAKPQAWRGTTGTTSIGGCQKKAHLA